MFVSKLYKIYFVLFLYYFNLKKTELLIKLKEFI